MESGIPQYEFKERISKIQHEILKNNLDALFVFSSESEPANVRYLSNYWPSFETAAVIIVPDKDPILVIGPESETYARDRSVIKDIRRVLVLRESSAPDYPGHRLNTFSEIFDDILGVKKLKKLGIVGSEVLPISIYHELKEPLKDTQIIEADHILRDMRTIKSDNEIKLMKKSFHICELALEDTFNKIKAGMTEIEVVALAEYALLSNGAESTAYPLFGTTGERTNQAISRPTSKKIEKSQANQLNVGARVEGYCSSVGRPFVIGKIPNDNKNLMETALAIEDKVMESLKAGIDAKDVAVTVQKFAEKLGYGEWLLYGPCHGVGLMECEPPWIETNADYKLRENMTFDACIFLGLAGRFGVHFEDGIRIKEEGIEKMSDYRREVITL